MFQPNLGHQNARRPSIAKQIRTVNKVLYVLFFFTHKGPIIQIPVSKDNTVTGKFCKNVVLRKLENYYKWRRTKSGLKYLRLLLDNAPTHVHKTRIVTEFLESKKVTILPHPQILPDMAPATIFCVPNLNICLSGKR